jgi:predicted metal-dependent HD superfamily phosphohydrolase
MTNPAGRARLESDWAALLAPFGVRADAAHAAFHDLAAAYSGAGRFYHNLDHIRQVLAVIDGARELAANLPAVRLAAWLHDVVYDTHAADNEARSATYAGRVLAALDLPRDLIAQVQALILATKDHRAADADSALLLDADLSTLGSEYDQYRRYARAIRREYAWVPEAEYRSGRAKVLESFLRRERIYHTQPLFAALEAQARRNLAAELRDLGSDSGEAMWIQ